MECQKRIENAKIALLTALVEERKVETDKWVFVEGCKNPKVILIRIRGGSQRIVDEAEIFVHDAIMAVKYRRISICISWWRSTIKNCSPKDKRVVKFTYLAVLN